MKRMPRSGTFPCASGGGTPRPAARSPRSATSSWAGWAAAAMGPWPAPDQRTCLLPRHLARLPELTISLHTILRATLVRPRESSSAKTPLIFELPVRRRQRDKQRTLNFHFSHPENARFQQPNYQVGKPSATRRISAKDPSSLTLSVFKCVRQWSLSPLRLTQPRQRRILFFI